MTAPRRRLSIWTLALFLVLGLHLAVGAWALYWQVQTPPVEPIPPAMLVELAPLPAAPPPSAPPPPRVEPEAPKPPPKLVEAPKPELALPPPKPKPKPKPPAPKPQPVAPAEPLAAAPVTPAAPAPPAPAAAPPAAPQPSSQSGPSQAEVKWQSKLLAHLNRYKRYPSDAQRRGVEGTSSVRFTLDGAGKVLAVSLAHTAGNASLDRATLAMIRRAEPLPPPPKELLEGGSLEVVAPFVYSLDRRR
ncbi:MAG: TonB family protein [Pseudomonadota bacterium]